MIELLEIWAWHYCELVNHVKCTCPLDHGNLQLNWIFFSFLLLLFFLFWLDQVTTAEYQPVNACPTLALCKCLVKFEISCHHCEFTIFYSSLLSLFLVNLLAGKCSRAIKGRGALVFWSNPLTQTNPEIVFRNFFSVCFFR